jgi:hypothetical protein
VTEVTGNPDGLRSLAKYSKLPVERIRYVPDAGAEILQTIDRGILFLMAFWSIHSVRGFTALTEVLAHLGAEELELVVVDVDGSPKLFQVPELWDNPHCCGETAWIRQGKIVATSGIGLNPDCFEPNTRMLRSLP